MKVAPKKAELSTKRMIDERVDQGVLPLWSRSEDMHWLSGITMGNMRQRRVS